MNVDSATASPEIRPDAPLVEPIEPPVFRLGYRPELDGIRAFAVLAVLLRHAPIPGWPAGLLRGGWIGVDIFFVLSGFLITTLLLEEHRLANTFSLKRFYIRRVLRLGPALIVLLIVWCAYGWAAFTPEDAKLTCRQALVTLLYVSNWVEAYCLMPMDQFAPTWSLAIEEQFYLVWPLTLAILLRAGLRTRGLLGVLIAGILVSALLRVLMLGGESCGLERLYYGSDTRADALLIGCAVGVLAVRGTLRRIGEYNRTLGVLAIGAVALLVWVALSLVDASWQLYVGLFTVVSLATAVVVTWILCHPERRVVRMLASAPLVWIGRRSYGMYLWNLPVAFALSSPLTVLVAGLEPHWMVTFVIYIACNFLVAALSFRYVEQPVLDLKRRFEAVRT